MELTEKEIVINKIKEMPEEQLEKVMIFITGLEAGFRLQEKAAAQGGVGGQGLPE